MSQLRTHPDPDTLDAIADCFQDESEAIEDDKVAARLERIAGRIRRRASEERHG